MNEARPSLTRTPALARAVDLVFTWPGYLAGALYILLAFFVTYDVLARKWGSDVGLPTTRVTDEISGYMLALAATWGSPSPSEPARTSASTSCSRTWPIA